MLNSTFNRITIVWRKKKKSGNKFNGNCFTGKVENVLLTGTDIFFWSSGLREFGLMEKTFADRASL